MDPFTFMTLGTAAVAGMRNISRSRRGTIEPDGDEIDEYSDHSNYYASDSESSDSASSDSQFSDSCSISSQSSGSSSCNPDNILRFGVEIDIIAEMRPELREDLDGSAEDTPYRIAAYQKMKSAIDGRGLLVFVAQTTRNGTIQKYNGDYSRWHLTPDNSPEVRGPKD